MRTHVHPLKPIAMTLVCIGLASPAAAQFVVHPIAVSGDPAPDRPGTFFDGFNGLSLNDAGDVAIVGQTAFNVGGIWKTAGGTLALVTDSSFNEFVQLLNDGRLIHGDAARVEIFDGANVTTVAEWDQPVSSRPDLTFYQLGQVSAKAATGNFLFTALTRLTAEPNGTPLSTLLAYRNGVLEVIGRGSEPLTAVGPNYIYDMPGEVFPPGAFDMAANGDVAYVARFQLPGTDPRFPVDRGIGLFLRSAGTTVRLYMDGDLVPGTVHSERFVTFKSARIDDAGRVVFSSILKAPTVDESNRLAWYVKSSGSLNLLLRTGQPVPDLPAGTVYRALRDVSLTPTGLTFISVTNDMPDPQLGTQRLWSGPVDDLAEIVSADWLADPPGDEGDTATLIRLTDNESGQFVYQAADVVGDAYLESLRLRGVGISRRVVRVGDSLSGRTVSALLEHAINDAAEIAVHVRFDDDSDGIFLFTMIGDFDRDVDVDMGDFSTFLRCYAGQNRAPAAGCGADADFDRDGDVDVADFVLFSESYTGSL